MTSDEQLMLQFQKGAGEAFGELFRRYREPIYGFFRRRLGDAARAEELAQEVFLAILRNAARYEPLALFRTYLYGIAMNLLSAERRKAGREEGAEALDCAVAADPVGDPDTAIWVQRAIGSLEQGQREVLLLREYEQLSYEEIAELLHLPLNTVRTRLFRARMALKNILLARRESG